MRTALLHRIENDCRPAMEIAFLPECLQQVDEQRKLKH
jgi:hypothetical protein